MSWRLSFPGDGPRTSEERGPELSVLGVARLGREESGRVLASAAPEAEPDGGGHRRHLGLGESTVPFFRTFNLYGEFHSKDLVWMFDQVKAAIEFLYFDRSWQTLSIYVLVVQGYSEPVALPLWSGHH